MKGNGMTLGFDKSKESYRAFIKRAHDLVNSLQGYGYKVVVANDIELGATVKVYLLSDIICEINWNVPYYISFESFVALSEQSYEIDNVKNIKDWITFFDDIEHSLQKYSSDHTVKKSV